MHINKCPLCVLIVFGGVLFAASAFAQDWTEFRGPAGSGISNASDLPEKWEQETTVWKTDLEGKGWSSPVIVGNEIWLTTATVKSARVTKEAKPNDSKTAKKQKRVALKALCINRTTGAVERTVDLFKPENPPFIHSLNSYASPTPVIDRDVVFCTFGSMGTAAIKRSSGEVLWRNNLLKFEHQMGPGSSAVVVDDLLIFHCDGTDKQFVVALSKKDGQVVWKTDRSGKLDPSDDQKKAYSTPTLIDTPYGRQLISPGANWVYAYDPTSGKEIWKVSFGKLGFSNTVRPVFANDLIYFTTGFMRSTQLAVQYGNGKDKQGKIVWKYEGQVPTMSSPIVVDDLLFMVSDSGIATCLDALSGERQWRERLAGEFSASPVYADGKVYFGNREGLMISIAPSREFKILSKNQLDGDIMATPVPLEKSIYVRTRNSLYRFQKPPKK